MKKHIDEAVKILREGGIILYPTDTIWGIGCDATNKEAVEKIYKIKERQDSKSLIVLAGSMDMIYKYVREVPEIAVSLIEVSDKPLTIIYPEGIGLAPNILADDNSIAIRVPINQFCIELINRFNRPIISTSANISGKDAPKTFDGISIDIKSKVDWIADPDLNLDRESTRKASSIIKIGLTGEIRIIRE